MTRPAGGSPGIGEAGRDRTRNRDGRDKARLFRQYRLSPEQREARRCELDVILSEDSIDVCESAVESCGYEACLIRVPGGGGGIMIAAGQDLGRRRFSIAHELGHYHIPSHAEVGMALYCADADLRMRSYDARQREWEANDFATELLMPFRLYSQDAAKLDPTFDSVRRLAAPEMYDVSLTAAAWRLVETTRQMCAMVVAVNGSVQWVVRSDTWAFPLAERRRPLPAGSIAHAVAGGEQPQLGAEEVDPSIWLTSADGRVRPHENVTLFESTHAVTRLGQVVSLLWAVDE